MTEPTSWHALPVDDALARLNTSLDGLTPAAAAGLLERYGPNRIAIGRATPAWAILAAQFRSVVVLLLVVATAVAWAIGDALEAAAVGAVLVINAAIGFVTELRARRAMEALRRLEVPRAMVIRGGRRLEISATELVPGDVIEVESGKSVPADARLISVADLRVNEAPLTGESLPVEKRADTALAEDTMLAERTNMIYQATAVVSGTARAVVTATGNATELGKIGTLTSGVAEERTPLEHRLDALGRRLVWVALAVAGLVALLGRARGASWGLVLQTGIALAIAAVPEGLPAVATITLAVGVWRMARRRAVVRRLPAAETLGSVTTVGADKTGTLTAGEMSVTTIVADGREIEVTGSTYAPEGEFKSDGRAIVPAEDSVLAEALRIGALANHADVKGENGTWRAIGDPTEAALLVAAQKAGIARERLRRQLPDAGEIPFSSERQWMATFHRTPDDTLRAYVKGAPGRIIERSVRELCADGERPLDQTGRQRLLEKNQTLAARGLRVLALARADVSTVSEEAARALTFVGFVGIADPPAPEVKETIRRLREGGIRTVMITGDQRLTAVAVARELGIIGDTEGAMDGRELATLDEASLAARLEHTGVFNRVSPADKLRIVEALQRRGEIVAMLGDGVNDAAALKKADIGVAMGMRGTDIAKEAADIVLADDRFSTIAAAVEEGRVIFDNIRKFVFFLFSCNLAEVLVLLAASVIGLPQPLLPLQILWLNLVTDTFPALALAVEPAEPDLMRRPPRDPQEAILSRAFLERIAFYAVLIAAATLAAFVIALRGDDPARAGTVAFMTLALAQTFHLGNARRTAAVLQPRHALSNPWALGSVALVVALQMLAMYLPGLARVLRVVPLTTGDWALVLVAAAVPAVVGQGIKLAARRGLQEFPNALGVLVIVMTMACGDSRASANVDHPGFVGSARCADCHATAYAAWQGSQHSVAMQVAQPTTVLGQFDSTRFTENGVTSTFFRRDGRYFVNTQGADGQPHDYEVRYTFGVSPLQQYLVELQGGRVQALALAWDARPPAASGQRWFTLNPGRRIAHTDDEHWSRRLYNWNVRCADCHSTAVRKNYEPDADVFRTSWSEISVGCEACHGPGARHVKWAKYPAVARRTLWRDNGLGARLTERRGVSWVSSPGAPTAHRSAPRTTDREIDVCAQCHARRIHIADGYTAGRPLVDYYIPFLLEAGFYYPDGQQREEVYNYGSFLQSKMYRAGLTCADCHDPHTQKLRRPAAQVCSQCHNPATYEATTHHLHGPQTGATCISCHMPSRTYMVIDPRHDHSFRIPRPDLSVSLGTPNACNQCHIDRDARWAERHVQAWYGKTPASQRFARAFAADDANDPFATDSLARVAHDTTESAIVRASALARLAGRPGPTALEAATRWSSDRNVLIRLAALEILEGVTEEKRTELALPLLRDETRAIRQGAAWILAPVAASLDPKNRAAFDAAADEFVASQRYNADQPDHRRALGAFYARLGQLDSAIREYRASLRLAPRFAQSYIDLADVLRVEGRAAEAERTLRDAVDQLPEDPGMHYALGLLLANSGRPAEALPSLKRAAALRPDVPEFARAVSQTARALAARRK